MYSQWIYSDPYAVERSATNLTNRGRVIGRIYYVRGENPSFSDDVIKWLSKPLSPSSRAETFTITIITVLLSGLSFWLFWEHLLYKKRIQEARMREREEELINRNKASLLQLEERKTETEQLKNLLEDESTKLKKQAEYFGNKNQRLQQEINNLQNIIEKLKLTNNFVVNQDELEQAQQEIERAYRNQHEQNEKIQQLVNQLQDYYVQLEIAKRKGESLKQIEIQIQHITEDKLSAEKELNQIRERENQLNHTIDKLKNKLTSEVMAQNELNKQLQFLQYSLAESKNQEQESHNKTLELTQQIEKLNQEIDLLIEETGNRPLNTFEENILYQIQNNLDTQEIHTLFDAGTGGERSKFVDLLVITNNCIFVIEAKAYRGEIKPTNDPRNSTWVSTRGNNNTLIKSSWGYNPYQQVNTYTNAILARRSRNWHPKKPIYGIIVFPSEARIDSEITSNMGKYYRVTTLNNLLATINELNH
ncbi:MAG: NERD domain-containing protein [Calothrix sp. FI2-JRJ7]|nr:NERD domain-containing protein [Calothrix sp. FI2-JRJ7]